MCFSKVLPSTGLGVGATTAIPDDAVAARGATPVDSTLALGHGVGVSHGFAEARSLSLSGQELAGEDNHPVVAMAKTMAKPDTDR